MKSSARVFFLDLVTDIKFPQSLSILAPCYCLLQIVATVQKNLGTPVKAAQRNTYIFWLEILISCHIRPPNTTHNPREWTLSTHTTPWKLKKEKKRKARLQSNGVICCFRALAQAFWPASPRTFGASSTVACRRPQLRSWMWAVLGLFILTPLHLSLPIVSNSKHGTVEYLIEISDVFIAECWVCQGITPMGEMMGAPGEVNFAS